MKVVKIAIVMPVVLTLALVAGMASVPGFLCAQLVRFAAWAIGRLTAWPYKTPKSHRLGAVCHPALSAVAGDTWE